MARAKKTERAEARRRYRAELLAQSETDSAEGAESADQADARPSRFARPAAAPVPKGQVLRMTGPQGVPALEFSRKPGMLGNVRGAYLPVRPLEDIRLLPAIALRTPAVLVPFALTAIAGALLVAGPGQEGIGLMFVSLMLFVPLGSTAMGGAFIAGLLAPRTGWLVGLLASVFAWLTTLAVIPALPVSAGDRNLLAASMPGMLTVVPFGAVVGAFSAWYRRFLKLSTPQRPQGSSSARRPSRPAPKPRPVTPKR